MSICDVFVLQHSHKVGEGDYDEDVKLIGVYSSRSKAELAIERLLEQPGFRECVDGFSISEFSLNEGRWQDGYITVSSENPIQ